MPANVESMFSVRQVPWHGLGTIVQDAPTSAEALKLAGLDWEVYQQSISTGFQVIPGYKANIRSIDDKVLGVVTDRYRIVQNHEAFAFTDALLGEGISYETAGSLQGGRKVWLLAKLPGNYNILGDDICPYIVFSNAHDGSGAIKVAMTPVRVVCQNTLNLALMDAKRIWSTNHTGDMQTKLSEAKKTLLLAEHYMEKLEDEAEELSGISLSDKRVAEFINGLLPIPENASVAQVRNVDLLRTDLQLRYFDAPDLVDLPKSAYRLINAVSDFSTHVDPLRRSPNYRENLFSKTMEGNPLVDKAYELLQVK